jgi:hypothetical protein
MSESDQEFINGEAARAQFPQDPIAAAIDAAIEQQEEITAQERAHLQHVYARAAQADQDLQQAVANQQACYCLLNTTPSPRD